MRSNKEDCKKDATIIFAVVVVVVLLLLLLLAAAAAAAVAVGCGQGCPLEISQFVVLKKVTHGRANSEARLNLCVL